MNNQLLLDNLRCIPDWPIKGVNFRDVESLEFRIRRQHLGQVIDCLDLEVYILCVYVFILEFLVEEALGE